MGQLRRQMRERGTGIRTKMGTGEGTGDATGEEHGMRTGDETDNGQESGQKFGQEKGRDMEEDRMEQVKSVTGAARSRLHSADSPRRPQADTSPAGLEACPGCPAPPLRTAHPAPPPRGRARWGGTGQGSQKATSRGGSGSASAAGPWPWRRGGGAGGEALTFNPKRQSVGGAGWRCRLPAAMEVTRGVGDRGTTSPSAWPPVTGRLSLCFAGACSRRVAPRRPLPGPGSQGEETSEAGPTGRDRLGDSFPRGPGLSGQGVSSEFAGKPGFPCCPGSACLEIPQFPNVQRNSLVSEVQATGPSLTGGWAASGAQSCRRLLRWTQITPVAWAGVGQDGDLLPRFPRHG